MEYCYKIDEERGKWRTFGDWLKRWVKWGVVRVAPGYFHKHGVYATYEEMAG